MPPFHAAPFSRRRNNFALLSSFRPTSEADERMYHRSFQTIMEHSARSSQARVRSADMPHAAVCRVRAGWCELHAIDLRGVRLMPAGFVL